MASTTNFNWTTPDDTDLVKDGAAAIRTLGSAIDTSLVDLKGGTTGQVLAKASNTDLDYTWSSVDPLTILDAKGDLISATAADTPARLAVGANGTVLTADSAEATGLKWATPSSGGMTLISTTSLSGSSTVLSSIPQTYTNLQVQIEGMTNNTAAGNFTIYIGSQDDLQYSFLNDGTAGSAGGGANITSPSTIVRTNAENGFNLTIFNYASSIVNHSFIINGSYTTTGALKRFSAFGTNGSSGTPGTISSLTFLNTGGTWSSGTVKLWGIK